MADLLSVPVVAITCCYEKCGMTFWVPRRWHEDRKNDHQFWRCPNGHSQHYAGKSEAEKLRDELEKEKRCCESKRATVAHLEEQLEHRERQIRGYKGKVRQVANRVKKIAQPAAEPDA